MVLGQHQLRTGLPEDLLAGSYAGLIDARTGAAAEAEATPRFEPVGLVTACGGGD